jgi:hypothetical protein
MPDIFLARPRGENMFFLKSKGLIICLASYGKHGFMENHGKFYFDYWLVVWNHVFFYFPQ